MSFLLDTNILSVHLRRAADLSHRFVQHSGRLFTSTIALAELYVWAYNRPDPSRTLFAIDELLFNEVSLIGFDQDCANRFGRERIQLRRQGIEVPTADLLIAAVALAFDLTLVTNNTSDFEKIPDLRLDDWLRP